jgi:hypothetical protein
MKNFWAIPHFTTIGKPEVVVINDYILVVAI